MEEPEFKVKKSSDKEVLFQLQKKDNSTAWTSYSTGDQFMGQRDSCGVAIIHILILLYVYTVYALHVNPC